MTMSKQYKTDVADEKFHNTASELFAALTFAFSGLACGTSYALGVEAYDAAGNVSPVSAAVPVTTPAAATPLFSDAAPVFSDGA